MKARHVRVLRRHIDTARKRSIRAPGKNGKVRTFRGAWDCYTDPIGQAVCERLKADGAVVLPERGYIQVSHEGNHSLFACPPGVEAWWVEVDAGTAQPFTFELTEIEPPSEPSGHRSRRRRKDGTWGPWEGTWK